MAADAGWYSQWFAGGWFPAVWFAPGDESAVPIEELRPGGGTPIKVRPRAKTRPAWIIPPQFAKPRRQNDDAAALLLTGAL